MSEITKSGILNAIKSLDEPGFNKNLVMLNSIKKMDIRDKEIDLFISLPVSPSFINESLKQRLSEAVMKNFPAIKKVNLELEAKGTVPHEISKT